MNVHPRVVPVAVAFVIIGVCSAQAAHTDGKHCANNYKKYCHQWGLETRGLENCMRKHGDTLTNACIAALVRAGDVSQAEVEARKNISAAKSGHQNRLGFTSFAAREDWK